MAVMQLYGCRKTPTKKKLVLSCLLVTPGVPALICLALPSLILKTVNLSLYSSRVPQSSPLCVHVTSGYNQSNHESCPAYPTCPYYCFSKSPIVVLSAKHDMSTILWCQHDICSSQKLRNLNPKVVWPAVVMGRLDYFTDSLVHQNEQIFIQVILFI